MTSLTAANALSQPRRGSTTGQTFGAFKAFLLATMYGLPDGRPRSMNRFKACAR